VVPVLGFNLYRAPTHLHLYSAKVFLENSAKYQESNWKMEQIFNSAQVRVNYESVVDTVQ
jgi:hypothetical protein